MPDQEQTQSSSVQNVDMDTPFDPTGEIQRLKDMVHASPMPVGLVDKADKMILRLMRMVQMGSYSKEFESLEQYIRTITSLPWGKYSHDNLDMANAQIQLNSQHYGLDHVKDMILEYMAVMKLQSGGYIPPQQKVAPTQTSPQLSPAPNLVAGANAGGSGAVVLPGEVKSKGELNAQMLPQEVVSKPTEVTTQAAANEMSRLQGSSSHAPVLCFVGIQGVGKTSIAKSIANALDRKFARVALGAMGHVSQIRGVSRTQPTAEPGQIIKAVISTGSMNPVILLDEIDKTSSESGLRADLMAALLEILDPEQNSTFVDHYIDYPIDLSKCLFITTANNLGGISAALKDRLEIVRFGSYNDEEKVHIAREYMLPKVRKATGLTESQLAFADDVWPQVVRPLGFDAGVRQLERTISILARKVARKIVEGETNGVQITLENFRDFIPEDIGVYS